MIAEAIKKIVDKQDLTYDEAYRTMHEIMSGETTPTQNAAFLAALSTKSAGAETTDEIAGCAAAMRELATPVEHPGVETLEIVGTGGDGANTFNISTTAAIICAAAGAKVTKHGNRAASSRCGTADCLEALGVNLRQDPDLVRAELAGCGIAFLFAQSYHAAMRYVGPIRKELGIRTVFNILGPLTNPARPEHFVLGVYAEYLAEPLAHVLESLGVRHGLVVYARDGMDEVSPTGETFVCELRDGAVTSRVVTPEQFGIARCAKADLAGGEPAENAATVRGILSGEQRGPRSDAALLNAAFGLYAADLAKDVAQGLELAARAVDSGAAARTLDAFVEQSNAGLAPAAGTAAGGEAPDAR
ncbi:MAG: anthranilate phosphoribosyltransferase [Coriobacteriales bacterium]|jgi:anthranilate phosphoribosyltransferase